MRENGRDRIYCLNNLRRLVEDEDYNKSKALFSTLYSIVGRFAASGGSIDKNSLLKEVGNQIVHIKSVQQKQFSVRTQEILNDTVLKVLKTINVSRNSLYSIGLKVEDGRLVNKLPYVKQAKEFLSKYDHIYTPWQRSNELVSEFNDNAGEILRTLQNNLRLEIRKLFPELTESNHFHVVSPNSYSLPSLTELTWDYSEKRDNSEIVMLFAANFSKLPNSSYGWVLSREIRGAILTADFIISSSTNETADPNIIVPILKTIGDDPEIIGGFNKLKLTLAELDSILEEFRESIKNLSENIDLGISDG